MRLRHAAIALLVGLATGCVSSSSGPAMAHEDVATITKGKTTEADLVRMFGQPQSRFTDSNGNSRLMWGSTHYQAPVLGMFSWGAGHSVSIKHLAVTLGPDGTASDYTMGENNSGGVQGK